MKPKDMLALITASQQMLKTMNKQVATLDTVLNAVLKDHQGRLPRLVTTVPARSDAVYDLVMERIKLLGTMINEFHNEQQQDSKTKPDQFQKGCVHGAALEYEFLHKVRKLLEKEKEA